MPRNNRRDPLCPSCRHNLSGSPRGQVMTCSECGEEFLFAEVQWSRRPADWTPLKGLLGAIRFLVARGVIALPVIIALVLPLTPILNATGQRRRDIAPFVLAFAIGLAISWLWVRGLSDAAGFTSALLVALATLATFAIMLAGVSICHQHQPLTERVWWTLVAGPSLVTLFWMSVETAMQSRRY